MAAISGLAIATAMTAVPSALLLILVWQERREPGARPYAYMLATMVVYCLCYAASLVITDPGVHEFVYPATAWIKLLVTVPWFLFVLEYTGRGSLSTRRSAAVLVAVSCLPLLILLTPYREALLIQEYAATRQFGVVLGAFEPGPLWLGFAIFGLALLLIGLAMLLEFLFSERERYGLQTGVLAIAGIIPGMATVARIAGIGPLYPFDLTPFAYAFVAPLVGYGMLRWDLFNFAPATQRVGHAAAIDDFGDAVLILDEDHRVVDLNDRAQQLFDRSSGSLVGCPVEALVDAAPVDADTDETVRVETSRGQRDFDPTLTGVDGPRDRTIGYTLILHDITAEKQRRQRFEVLNRILRHDLRNAMNAIGGYTSELDEVSGPEADWMIDRIERQAAHLMDLSEKARDIDRVTDPSRTRRPFDVVASITRVTDQIVADDAAVTRQVPRGLTMTSNPAIFEYALRYAIECLRSHDESTDPRIRVSAERVAADPPSIEVRITTSGDPVPAAEREVIESGEETPLAHSDDLDLWLVLWGVESLGGELTFLDGEYPGLRLQIPDLRPADAPGGAA